MGIVSRMLMIFWMKLQNLFQVFTADGDAFDGGTGINLVFHDHVVAVGCGGGTGGGRSAQAGASGYGAGRCG